MSGLQIRLMQVADAEAVAKLVRQSFDALLHPYLVYCQPGLDNYLRVVLVHPVLFPRHCLLVAEEQEAVLGFAEFRRLDDGRALLSYIAVDPDRRGRGIASRMMSAYVTSLGRGQERLELDVFQDNVPALTLYERLGFEPVSESAWIVRELPATAGGGEPVELADAHGSLAALSTYGFCRLPVRRSGRVLDAGLVSREVLRVPDRPSFQDDDLLGEMARVMPEMRRALLIGPADPVPSTSGAGVLLRSSRLSADWRSLEGALS